MTPNENRDFVSFGIWLKQRRQALDLTQAALAEKVGCAVVTIKKIEREERHPSLQMARLLADALAVPRVARNDFIRLARGHHVPSASSLQRAIHPPLFLKQNTESLSKEPPLFVNRKRELAQLNAHLKSAVSGNGRVVFITGDAGQGKSSLMAEFGRQAQVSQPDLVVASGQCNAIVGTGDPYLPFRDILGMFTGDLEGRWAAGNISTEQTMRLWELLPDAIQALLDNGPDLIDSIISGPPLLRRINASLPDRVDWIAEIQALITKHRAETADLEQSHLLNEMTEILRRLAARRPLLLLLDDLQWADDASMNLLFHLGRRLKGSRMLLLAAYRSEANPEHPQKPAEQPLLDTVITEFKRYYGDIQLDLNQQTTAERQGFIEALLDSEPNVLGDAFRERLFLHTQGHPLFTVELLHSMQADGTLIRDEDGRWVENMALFPQKLPVKVEAVIEHRISVLDNRLQDILAVGSVEGERFTAQIVAQVLELDEQFILQRLGRELEQTFHLLREQPEIIISQQTLNQYSFEHILFQDYLYNRLSQGERRLYHRQVAQALESIFKDYTQDIITTILYHSNHVGEGLERPYPDCLVEFGASLAHHFLFGHVWDRAAAYALCAGVGSMKVFAVREAISSFERAIQAVGEMPNPPYELAFEAIIRWEDAAFKFKPYDEQLERLALAEQIAREHNDTPRLIQALHWTANVHLARGLWTRAGPALMECLTLVEVSKNESFSVRPVYFQALMTTYVNPREALAQLERSLALAQKYEDRRIEILSLGSKGQMYAQLGKFKEAVGTLRQAYEALQRTDSPLTESDLDLLSGWTYLTMGDTQQGLEYGRQSVEKAIATDNMDCICYGFDCIGFGNLEMQRVAEAADAFAEAVKRSEVSGAVIPQLLGQAGLAMTEFFQGHQEAITEMETVLTTMQSYNDHVGAAEIARMLGTCLIQLGKLDQAEKYLKIAEDFYQRMEMVPYLARTLTGLAQLFTRQERTAEAKAVQMEAETLMATLNTSV